METKIKSSASDFTLRLGHMTARCSLKPVEAPESKGRGHGSYHYCTPSRKPVTQCYTDGEEYFSVDQLLRYYLDDHNKMVIVNMDAVAEARKSDLPKNVAYCQVHPIGTADDLYPLGSKKSHVVVPDSTDPANRSVVEVMIHILQSERYVILSKCNLQNHEGFYRLIVWRGQLVLQPQVWPESLNPHPTQRVKLNDRVSKLAMDLAKALEGPYDSSSYQNLTAARIAAVEATKRGRKTAARKPATTNADEFEAMLEAAIHAV